ncbi:MAG: Uma2 family endonuclease [Myxococcales bacterium]|nr:Uma2 family endonuclease [Myxococcales bacterium]
MEEGALEKHEFYEGAILAMAGGIISHSLLKTNLTGATVARLRGRPCRAFDADLRVRTTAAWGTTPPTRRTRPAPGPRSWRSRSWSPRSDRPVPSSRPPRC